MYQFPYGSDQPPPPQRENAMDIALVKVFAQTAGLAGLSLAVVVLVLRGIVRQRLFPRLAAEPAYRLLALIVILAGVVGLAGVVTWAWVETREGGPSPVSLALFAALVVAFVAAGYLFFRRVTPTPPAAPQPEAVVAVQGLAARGDAEIGGNVTINGTGAGTATVAAGITAHHGVAAGGKVRIKGGVAIGSGHPRAPARPPKTRHPS